MATPQVCSEHGGATMVVFCVKCVRQLCPACLVEQPLCRAASSEGHAFTQLDAAPGALRAQLDSMQAQLRREQTSLLDDASRLARDMQGCDEQLHAHVARVVHSMEEAIETLGRLQRAIRAAGASAIASVLCRSAAAAVESVTSRQRVEDVNARALSWRQLIRAIRSLRTLDDASLLTKIPFLRNFVRFAQPVAASTPSPPVSSPSPAKKVRMSSEQIPYESGIFTCIIGKRCKPVKIIEKIKRHPLSNKATKRLKQEPIQHGSQKPNLNV